MNGFMDIIKEDEVINKNGYLKYVTQNCIVALEDLEKVNTELMKKMREPEAININYTGSLNRIIQDYIIVRVAGLFDENPQSVSFFKILKKDINYIRIRNSEIIKYIIKMRHKFVAHNDKNYLLEFPETGKILSSDLHILLGDLLKLLK